MQRKHAKIGDTDFRSSQKNGLYIVTYTGILGSFSPDESSKFWQIPSGNLTVGY
jgi:hypothetical protein